jgi:hypothetical protein
MKYSIKILILLSLCLSFKAQNHPYVLIDSIPSTYNYDLTKEYEAISNTITDKELNSRDKVNYIQNIIYYHNYLLKSGAIYFNWTFIENYINTLTDNILKENNIDKSFKVALLRHSDFNASALDNGIIYVNIGMLATITDEAALVAILGHEISHAVNNDLKKTFVIKNNLKDANTIAANLIIQSHGSREFELRADNEGFKYATKLNYNLLSSKESFIKMQSEYKWYTNQYSYNDPKWYVPLDNYNKDKNINADSLSELLLDHPNNDVRIKNLMEVIKTSNGTQNFKMGKSIFDSIQKMAKLEQLFIDLEECDYKTCIKNSFLYYYGDKTNTDYLYYLCESLRRLIYCNPEIRNKGFLTEDCKASVFENNKGILHDVSYITYDSLLFNSIKADVTIKPNNKIFETYQQAYNYYSKLLKNNFKTKDELVTLALQAYSAKNFSECKNYINQLNSSTTKKNIDIINYISDSTSNAQLKTNSVDFIVTEEAQCYTKQGKNFIYNYKVSEKMGNIFNECLINNFDLGFGDKQKFTFKAHLITKKYHFYTNLFTTLKKLKPKEEVDNDILGSKTIFDENYWKHKESQEPSSNEVLARQKNLFILEPAFLDEFKNKNIKAIITINPIFYKHPLFGMYYLLEIAYYDPINKKYYYSNQQVLEKFNKLKLKNKLKKTAEKIRDLYSY